MFQPLPFSEDPAIAKGEFGASVALNKSESEPKFFTPDIRLS